MNTLLAKYNGSIIAQWTNSGSKIFQTSGKYCKTHITLEYNDEELKYINRTISSYTNSTITTIGSYAFQCCYSLTTASFPACTTIGSYAFYSCYSLTTVSFPACTTIGSYAFSGCSSLPTVSFPACASIGEWAFMDCRNLISLYLTGSIVAFLASPYAFNETPIGGKSAYAGTYGSIYVPASLLTSYKTATNWTNYSSRFVGI